MLLRLVERLLNDPAGDALTASPGEDSGLQLSDTPERL
jgi:hypothetical protein